MSLDIGARYPNRVQQERARHRRARFVVAALLPLLFIALCTASRLAIPGYTYLVLVDPNRDRVIYSEILSDGEVVTLTWTNSIFHQNFEEVFQARSGELVLTEITVADPNDPYIMEVGPEEVDDYYHVGGAFHAKGLERPFSDVMYRISEIGDPHFTLRDRVIAFTEEVGFDGRIHLRTRRGTLFERLLGLFPSF